MSGLDLQRRLASDLLKVGESRVVFNEDNLKEIKEAITREDIKSLINKGSINVIKKKGVSRGRAKLVHEQKKKGRKKGPGKKKGTRKCRTPKKRAWINKIRPQRALLSDLKEGDKIDKKQFRSLYKLSKSGFFRSRRHLKLYLSKLIGDKK